MRMTMKRLSRSVSLIAAGAALAIVTVIGASSLASAKEVVRVGHTHWPAQTFFYMVNELGWAPDIEFEHIIIDDPNQLFTLMATGELDVINSTVEMGPITAAQGLPVKLIALSTVSYGVDMIILHPDIKSPEELKGKQVAVLEGGLAQIYMATWLEQNGVGIDEVQWVNLIMNEAAAAMVGGEIAGGEFWQPWARNVLRDLPGAQEVANSVDPYWLKLAVLGDAMFMNADWVREKRDLAKQVMRLYYDAVQWWKDNPEEGNEIIAKSLQFEMEDVEVVIGKTGTLEDNKIYPYTLAEAAAFCGVAPGDPPFEQENGYFSTQWNVVNDWWVRFGYMEEAVPPERGIDCTIIGDLYAEGFEEDWGRYGD